MPITGLLLDPGTSITCPRCNQDFALSEGFARKALESAEAASSDALAKVREEERARQQREAERVGKERDAAHQRALAETRRIEEEANKVKLDALQRQLLDAQALNQSLEKREADVTAREKAIESRVAEAAAIRAAELVAGERRTLTDQLHEKERQLAESRSAEVQLRRDKAAVEDRAAALEVEVARKVDAARAELESRVRAQEQERAGLEKAELKKTIEDMQAKLLEANRKAEQGSQQLQGEVLEVAIEERLKAAFPLDTIEEVKKGQRGGDVLQHVVTRTGQAAGTILWEMKRAKDWQVPWTGKLEDDMRASGAAVGVLVTMPGALPKDWPSGALFALYEDVWVTQVSTAVGVGEALRAGLIDVHRQRVAAAGKGEKAEALYDYLTSPQFAQKLKAVYETFTRMREELESERNVTIQRWTRREKQLQLGAQQLLGVAGDIQGLAHQELKVLELQEPKIEEGGS